MKLRLKLGVGHFQTRFFLCSIKSFLALRLQRAVRIARQDVRVRVFLGYRQFSLCVQEYRGQFERHSLDSLFE